MKDSIRVEFIPAKHWWKCSKWKLLEDYVSVNGNVVVPPGFISDGASIPMFAQIFFSRTGRYFGAALVHDYLIDVEHDWSKANEEFNEELKALEIRGWRRLIILASVKLYYKFLKLIGKAD